MFNEAVISSGDIAPNDWTIVNNEFERIWKEAAVAQF
jgi:hypothetical protein